MVDVRFWVKRYKDEGWSPVQIPPGEKGPREGGWETKTFDISDFADDHNVGVHLGVSDLYDVDLDDKAAIVAADILLPATSRVSGRASKPRSHRFYYSKGKIIHVAYHGLGGASDTLVELRGWSKNGSPTQTMIPPSIHPSGERVEWDADGKPLLVEEILLTHGVRNVAIAVLVARHFPGQGNRHEPRMALAGFLLRAGVDPREVLMIGKAVMTIIGGDQGDWADVCRSTAAKFKAGEESMTGGKRLAELLLQGDEVLKRLNLWLGRTQQAEVEEVIERFNAHHFIVEVGTTMAVADDTNDAGIKLWPFTEFKKKYCKEFMPGVRDKKGVLKRGRPQAEVWLEHPKGRRQGELLYVPPGSDVVLKPGDYNGWRGFACEPRPGEWPLLLGHIYRIICNADDALTEWVLNWCAALVQRPGEPGWSSIVLQGGQGVGKGTFAYDLLGKLFHPRHFAHIIHREQFYGRFNDILSGRCLIFLDEATWGGNKQDAGVIKGVVTSKEIIIERKGLPSIPERSMLHTILASNEDWPVGISRDDRRFTVLKIEDDDHANRPEYFEPIYDELRHGGREAFLYDMLQRPVDDRALRQPPATVGKDELKSLSRAPEEEWWLERLQEGHLLGASKRWEPTVQRVQLYSEYIAAMQLAGVSRRLTPELLGRAIHRYCPDVEKARPQRGGPRCYIFPSLSETRQAMERYLKSAQSWDAEHEALPESTDDGPF